MTFTGEREYIQRALDYWWGEIEAVREELPTATIERQQEIEGELWAITLRYDVLLTQLDGLLQRY
jgi:mannose-6-phosphate isomerase class I